MVSSLFAAARDCLDAATPDAKLALTFATAEAFAAGELDIPDDTPAPEPVRMPGRPGRPVLVHPRELPKRGFGTDEGRAAFVHAIAHIEFNAIDLAWDAVYRFRGLPHAYYADWVAIASDEARHFAMLRTRLRQMGFDYGDFDAHNGLWEMAESTAHDGLARAIRPVHSMFDGDTIFCLSTGQHTLAAASAPGLRRTDTRPGVVNTLLAAAADCFALACTRAVIEARSIGGAPSYRDLCPSAFPTQK